MRRFSPDNPWWGPPGGPWVYHNLTLPHARERLAPSPEELVLIPFDRREEDAPMLEGRGGLGLQELDIRAGDGRYLFLTPGVPNPTKGTGVVLAFPPEVLKNPRWRVQDILEVLQSADRIMAREGFSRYEKDQMLRAIADLFTATAGFAHMLSETRHAEYDEPPNSLHAIIYDHVVQPGLENLPGLPGAPEKLYNFLQHSLEALSDPAMDVAPNRNTLEVLVAQELPVSLARFIKFPGDDTWHAVEGMRGNPGGHRRYLVGSRRHAAAFRKGG